MQSHAYAGGAFLSNVFLFLPFYLFAVYSILFYYFILLLHLYIDRFTGSHSVLFSARKRYE